MSQLKWGLAVAALLMTAPVQAALLPGYGEITGTINAKKGDIVTIYMMNTDKSVGYSVYAVDGKFRANDLIPGHYEITVRKSGYEMAAVPLDVKADGHFSTKLNVTFGAAEPDYVGGGTRGDTKLVTFAQAYPPGKGRDIVERVCFVCHGPNFLAGKILDKEGWNSAIDFMTQEPAFQRYGLTEGPSAFDGARLPPKDREVLVDYLAKNFGPESEPRTILQDSPPPLDPAALSKAMFIEYRAMNSKDMPHRYTQEVHFDKDGNVFATDRGRPAAIVRWDPRTGDSTTFKTPNPTSSPHGITVDFDGTVWWAGSDVLLGHLDPKTGQTDQYVVPELGIMGHTPVFNHQGDLWFSQLTGNKIGHWDRKTDTITYYEAPDGRSRPYGLVIDNKDKVWFVEYHTDYVTRFDPETKEFKRFLIKSHPAQMRRLGVDANDIIWYGVYGSPGKKGKVGRLDPKTGEVTERDLPIGFSNPYDAWPDNMGNIWVSTDNYMVRMDDKTGKYTTYPIPERTDQPKVMTTKDGAVWYAPRMAGTGKLQYGAVAAVLYPDMDAITTLGAYYDTKSSANYQATFKGPATPVTGAIKQTKLGAQNKQAPGVNIVGKDPAKGGSGGSRAGAAPGMAD